MELGLKSYKFRQEREKSWVELEDLLEQVEKQGIRSLDAPDLARLPVLYRATLSSLSVARSISLDKNVLTYLETLATRAYFTVYGTRRHLREAAVEFFFVRFPENMRRFRWYMVVSTLVLLLGMATGFFLTLGNEERFYAFVGPGYAQGRTPATSTDELREGLYKQEGAAAALGTFASFLFSNNAKIGILCFALGFAAGLPVFFLLFLNGLILGAFAALYHSRGLGWDWWGWVLPHGVTELLAVIVCGGCGLVLGQALVFPGRSTRLRNLAQRGREVGLVVLGAVVMFFCAAIIEGIFRQVVTEIAARYLVIFTSAIFWVAYFALAGRRARS